MNELVNDVYPIIFKHLTREECFELLYVNKHIHGLLHDYMSKQDAELIKNINDTTKKCVKLYLSKQFDEHFYGSLLTTEEQEKEVNPLLANMKDLTARQIKQYGTPEFYEVIHNFCRTLRYPESGYHVWYCVEYMRENYPGIFG